MLTQEQIDSYVNSGGSNCPYCGHDKLGLDDRDNAYGSMYRDVECEGCGRTWQDVYNLSTIIEEED